MQRISHRLERLEKFLLNLPDNGEAMLLEELDGFIAGILVCPDLIMPGRWLPQVWGHGNDQDAPVFDSMEQVQTITGLIMEHYNAVATSLNEGRVGYEPLFSVDTHNDDILWELWMEGFGQAMALNPASWIAIIESGDQDAIEAFKGLQTLKTIAEGESMLPRKEKDRLTLEAPSLIPEWVETLNAWRLVQAIGHHVIAKPSFGKAGRNDPCPCGSGKKYKKCCGMN